MKRTLLAFALLFVASCSTQKQNQVSQIEPEQTSVKYKETGSKKRFTNLYPGEKEYPLTCKEDCYPASPKVTCEQPKENCVYKAEQKAPEVAANFEIQWLGHASFHITAPNGESILFDPVSQQFDWPVNWGFRITQGFNRNEPNWKNEQELADVDAVLYSHIHYDHFNKDDIATMGTKPEYYTPLGFAEHFEENGYRINEMAWYAQSKVKSLNLHFVPAHHFSSRIWVPFIYEDQNMTLWGGWVLEQNGKKLFFAGDTGYSKHFQDINERYGAMDICLIPVASYFHEEHTKWYRYVHTTPEDALVAAGELECKVMIPWGYGNNSWKMGDKSSHSPLLRLLKMHEEHTPELPLYILNEGEKVRF